MGILRLEKLWGGRAETFYKETKRNKLGLSFPCIGGGFPLVTGPLERDSTVVHIKIALGKRSEKF